MNKEQAIEYLFYSLGATIILLIGILSPNIVYLIHKKWFTWKKHRICLNCNKDYGLVDVDVESCENCGHYLYNKTK